MMIAFWVTLGIVAYLNIGYRWGRLSWKAWGKKSRSFAGLICFPVSFKKDKIGSYIDDGKNPYPLIVDSCKTNDEYGYAKGMALVWPLKALFNLCSLLYFGLKYFFSTLFDVIVKIASKIVDVAISPSRVVSKKPDGIPEAKALHKKSS